MLASESSIIPRNGKLAVAVQESGATKTLFGAPETKAITSLALEDAWETAKHASTTCGEVGASLLAASRILPAPVSLPVAAASRVVAGAGVSVLAVSKVSLTVYGSILNGIDELIHFFLAGKGVRKGGQRDLLTKKRAFAKSIDRAIKILPRLTESQVRSEYSKWNQKEEDRVELYKLEGSWKNGNQIAILSRAYRMAMSSRLGDEVLKLDENTAIADVKRFSKGCLTKDWLETETPDLNKWVVRALTPREEGVVAW